MIQKVVKKRKLHDDSDRDDLQYWLGLSPEQRIEALEKLRAQFYGHTKRLQRVARVIQQKQTH